MTTRFSCWLDGQGLQDIDPALYITDVVESAPDQEVLTSLAPGGLRVTGQRRRSLTVTIEFVLRERSPMRRAALLQRITAWAGGRLLTLGHRPGQQLPCLCTVLPEPGSALKWHAPLSVSFTAFASPYWEAVQPATVWITPAVMAGSAVLMPVGTAASAPVEALVYNAGTGTVQSLALTCGETRLSFEQLGLLPGERLHVSHDDHGFLRLQALSSTVRSVMPRRTMDSSDDLLACCGRANAVSVTSDQPVTAKFIARGRFA